MSAILWSLKLRERTVNHSDDDDDDEDGKKFNRVVEFIEQTEIAGVKTKRT